MTPAPPPPAFLGHLVDIGIDFGPRQIILHVKLPLHDLDGVFKTIGVPPGYDRQRRGPNVILLPPGPLLDSGDTLDFAVEAALGLLERVARDGLFSLTQGLVDRVGDLAELYGAIDKADAP